MSTINRTCVLSHALYPPECVDKTIEEFRLLCEVQKKISGNETEITVSVLAGAPKETPDEFLNFLLSASIETLLA